ncbi:hypothetical protein J6590_053018 [Homalodisca vitripennis]|nr:hypothetical protein J6590_053018 [Homalodisca vitripennis]
MTYRGHKLSGQAYRRGAARVEGEGVCRNGHWTIHLLLGPRPCRSAPKLGRARLGINLDSALIVQTTDGAIGNATDWCRYRPAPGS